MGLFDSVLGNILGGGASGKGIDYIAIMQWVEQQGGLQAILDKFRQGQFGDIVGSWLGNGETNRLPAITYSRRWAAMRSISWLKSWVSIRLRPPAPLHSFANGRGCRFAKWRSAARQQRTGRHGRQTVQIRLMLPASGRGIHSANSLDRRQRLLQMRHRARTFSGINRNAG